MHIMAKNSVITFVAVDARYTFVYARDCYLYILNVAFVVLSSFFLYFFFIFIFRCRFNRKQKQKRKLD